LSLFSPRSKTKFAPPSIAIRRRGKSWPGARGNTSGDVTKFARLETGLEIKVPLYVQENEKVRVYTETEEFAGRA
jgi:hypothetical protein